MIKFLKVKFRYQPSFGYSEYEMIISIDDIARILYKHENGFHGLIVKTVVSKKIYFIDDDVYAFLEKILLTNINSFQS